MYIYICIERETYVYTFSNRWNHIKWVEIERNELPPARLTVYIARGVLVAYLGFEYEFGMTYIYMYIYDKNGPHL